MQLFDLYPQPLEIGISHVSGSLVKGESSPVLSVLVPHRISTANANALNGALENGASQVQSALPMSPSWSLPARNWTPRATPDVHAY